MKFIDKLLESTRHGKIDDAWNFFPPDRYKYRRMFDPLTNLNFSLSDKVIEFFEENNKIKNREKKDKGLIIFPNGASLEVDREKLLELSAECKRAIIRFMEHLSSDYVSGKMEADLQAKQDAKDKQESKSEEASTDEEQED